MKATITIILAILSLATFSEGTDGNPTIWNFIGVASLATLALLHHKSHQSHNSH